MKNPEEGHLRYFRGLRRLAGTSRLLPAAFIRGRARSKDSSSF